MKLQSLIDNVWHDVIPTVHPMAELAVVRAAELLAAASPRTTFRIVTIDGTNTRYRHPGPWMVGQPLVGSIE